MKSKTFTKGGIHLNKYKLSSDIAIEDAGIPEVVTIPVRQHIGNPAKMLVKVGDKVKVGTHLADADGIISADVHSSVSGEVTKIEDVPTNIGYLEKMITIKVEGDEWEPSIDRSPDLIKDIPYSAEEIVQKIQEAGIVGMGGAGFPTPVKTKIPEGRKVDFIILNGIECEPYLTTDERLMVEHAEQIIIGAKILNKALGIQNAIVAIDENKTKAIEIMTNLTKRYVGVNVRTFKTKYPQGAEKQLIEAITGREVPSGKLPSDVGCVVQNVATVYAIYEAVMKNKPLFERVITISGDKADKLANFRTRIGTPASFIINQVVTNPEARASINLAFNTSADCTLNGQEQQISNKSEIIGKVIFGGPMMGQSGLNIDAPITKTTSGILLFSEELSYIPQETSCLRCGKCIEVCAMGLQPYAISYAVREGSYDIAKKLSAMDCIECGACSYTCPAKIPLTDYCKLAKYEIRKQKPC